MSGQGAVEKAGINVTRRDTLAGGSAVGALLLPAMARAQGGAGAIQKYAAPRQIPNVDHKIVFRDDKRYSGWTYVIGFWNMRDGELLQSFFSVPTDYSSADAVHQDKLPRHLGKVYTVRSKDHGRTWSKPVIDMMANVTRGWENARTLADLGPIDYLDSNVLVANNSVRGFGAPNSQTSINVSRDRGKSWSPSLLVPLDGLPNHSGMNSYMVRPDGTAMIWLMESGKEGWNRHPLVFALPPRGTDFHFLSMITEVHDPKGAADGGDRTTTLRFGGHRWMYPRGWMLPSGRILCTLRSQRDPRGIMWTEVYFSDDGGRTWDFLSRVNDFGAPASLVVMPDGRIVAVYGYRLMPAGIRCKVSEDQGRTWGPELIVRDDGGSWDLGYPNAWATDDGKVGVIYWFNSRYDKIQVDGGVRHIQRSIFSID
ncbi:MAG: sialidase family protein [Sphingomonas sp.]